MRRLVWVGVGVVVTVVVIRKGRAFIEAYAPKGTTEVASGIGRLSVALAGAQRDFRAAMAEREAELRHGLIGDVDVDELRRQAPRRREDLRGSWESRGGRHAKAPRVPADWAGPTEDPDDDAEAAFF